MTTPVVALYARVSSEQQAQAQTIDSQLAALRERIASDGGLLNPEHEFVDAGYSGSTLIRPALERLRDAVAAGGVERVSGGPGLLDKILLGLSGFLRFRLLVG